MRSVPRECAFLTAAVACWPSRPSPCRAQPAPPCSPRPCPRAGKEVLFPAAGQLAHRLHADTRRNDSPCGLKSQSLLHDVSASGRWILDPTALPRVEDADRRPRGIHEGGRASARFRLPALLRSVGCRVLPTPHVGLLSCRRSSRPKARRLPSAPAATEMTQPRIRIETCCHTSASQSVELRAVASTRCQSWLGDAVVYPDTSWGDYVVTRRHLPLDAMISSTRSAEGIAAATPPYLHSGIEDSCR